VRVAVAATPDVAIPTLEWLIASKHEIVWVITQPDRPSGRGLKNKESAVSLWAQQRGLKVTKPESSLEILPIVQGLDLVITIGYGVILPESILNVPKHGFLNLHFSLLPHYRGAAPVQRALENGETETGVTVFKLDRGMDTGPIFVQEKITIDSTWRSFELLNALSVLGVQAIGQAISSIEQAIDPVPQSGKATIASKITKSEAQIDFRLSAAVVVQKIKAFTYEPGAWTTFNKEPFKIFRAVVSKDLSEEPGYIFLDDDKVLVSCGSGSCIEIMEVKPAGKREMSAIEWSRGARLTEGVCFG
jgi:methionyl-tRNA formyltransferase